MAFQLNGSPLAVDVAFKTSDGTQYPANWLRLSTAEEKTAIGITEVADPTVYDLRFYNENGSAKTITDTTETIDGVDYVTLGVKSVLKAQEKNIAGTLLAPYDWYVIRKAEKSTAIPSEITTYRDAVRTAYTTRKTEIDNCADTAALVTLYGSTEQSDKTWKPNMTQYPIEPST